MNTYIIKSEFLDEKDAYNNINGVEYIKDLLKKRGNWREIDINIAKKEKIKTIDFVYLDGIYLYDKEINNYLKDCKIVLSNITNMVSDNDSISNKYKLIDNLKKTDIPRKHLLEQYYVNLYNIYHDNKKSLKISKEFYTYYEDIFNKYKILIFKPIHGIQGKDIRVFDNVKDFIKYIEELIIDKKNLLSTMNIKDYYKTGMKAQYKFFNIEWVLQEYIDNPLLFNEKKFHIRGYFIYHYFNSKETEKKEKKYYISKNMKIFTAISPYKNNDYYNKDIHDTHAGSSIKGLSFYNDLSNMLGKDKTNYVYEQIKNIFKYVGKIINSKCFEEALNCFHIFGYDVMITENLDVKIIETNYRPGYPRLDIFDGIMTKIIDYHFPPLNIQEDSDNIN